MFEWTRCLCSFCHSYWIYATRSQIGQSTRWWRLYYNQSHRYSHFMYIRRNALILTMNDGFYIHFVLTFQPASSMFSFNQLRNIAFFKFEQMTNFIHRNISQGKNKSFFSFGANLRNQNVKSLNIYKKNYCCKFIRRILWITHLIIFIMHIIFDNFIIQNLNRNSVVIRINQLFCLRYWCTFRRNQ